MYTMRSVTNIIKMNYYATSVEQELPPSQQRGPLDLIQSSRNFLDNLQLISPTLTNKPLHNEKL